jgi:hypothetical protein
VGILRVALFTIATALWSVPSHSQIGPSQAEWINAMRQGEQVIVLRHGATHTDQADTDPFHLENVAQQRQLTDQGRAPGTHNGSGTAQAWHPGG